MRRVGAPRHRTRLGPAAVLATGLALLTAAPAAAQDELRREIRESQLRLEQIRQEREELQREMESLRARVSDASTRLANIERQVAASAAVLRELDFQQTALARSVEETTRDLIQTRDRLTERRVVLARRLRSIYKRGPLHTVQVLFSARSFGDLLSRYKYLHLIALYDRLLVDEVTRLEANLVARERDLTASIAELQRLRADKLGELAHLQSLEAEQQRALESYREREQQAQGRLAQLERDEARLTNLIAELERRRLEEERRRAVAGRAATESTITTADIGNLAWPVEGRLIYRFGPERRPNGVTLRWNGIGIGAAPGTEVRAVEAGTVVMAGPFEGYGPSVMISHGGGIYTLYLYLGRVAVREGQTVMAGQVLGTVGGERTPEGPHIEFQVRAPTRSGGMPEPVDPLTWLRRRSGP